MAFSDGDLAHEGMDPIDIVETLAEHRAWEFDRVADDQIAMAVEGQWRTYSLTLAWSARDETLRLICTFEMEPPAARMPAVYELLNLANDEVWAGAFTYWPEQIEKMIAAAVANSERFYPAFQLAAWSEQTPEAALRVAIAEAYGRA